MNMHHHLDSKLQFDFLLNKGDQGIDIQLVEGEENKKHRVC